MLDQLWFTSCLKGLRHVAGFQARAASAGLRDVQSHRYASIEKYLRYSLPKSANPAITQPADAPLGLALINTGNERILLNRAFIGRNFDGRPGNIFLHLVAGLPAEFTAREAIALWQSQWWIYDDRTLAQDQFDLPQVAGAELLHGNGTIDRTALASPEMQRILPLVIQAILVKEPGQHIYIAAPPDKVAVLVWGVAQCLPDNLLRGLTFSTYEYDASAGVTDIIGSCGWPLSSFAPCPAIRSC